MPRKGTELPRGVLTSAARYEGMEAVDAARERSERGATGGGRPVRRARTSLVVGVFGTLLVLGVAAFATAGPVAERATAASAAATSPPPADDDVTGGTAGRFAAQSPTPEPSLAPTTPPTTPADPVDPTIGDPGDITTAIGRFHGTGTPGDGVRVARPDVPTASVCTATVSASGSWSCTGTVESGPQQVFTVIDTTEHDLHAADAPAADVVVPPEVTTPSTPTTGGVTGTGLAGAVVTVAASGTTATRTTTVGTDGRWYVSWSSGADPLRDGRWSMTATQTAGTSLGFRTDLRSSASTAVSVTVDRTAPAAPRITAPTDGATVRTQPVTVRGTGEDGDVVTVYVDSSPVCQARVGSGSWSCSTAGSSLPDGDRVMTAGERDAAGNFSSVSGKVRLAVSDAPADTPPPSPGSGSSAGTPGGGTGSDGSGGGGTGDGSGGSGGSESSSGSGSEGSGGTGGGATGTDGGTGSGTGSFDVRSWATATTYDAAVPTIQSAASWSTLLAALAGAAGFLLLVAAPLKLASRTARGRIAWRLARFTGRNRSVVDRTPADDEALPVWVPVVASVVLASLLALLGTGVAAEPRYARLALAVVLGNAILTAGVVLAARWAAGARHGEVAFRFSPWMVLGSLVACAVTRGADLSPAVLIGVLVVPVVPSGPEPRAAALGRDATWRTVSLLVLAAAGWVLHSVVTGHGFAAVLVSELAITLCVGGIGTLVATVVPLAGSGGAAVWALSRGRYAALAAVVLALAVAVYSGADGTHLSFVAIALSAVVCTLLGVVTWTWVRVVEPVLRG